MLNECEASRDGHFHRIGEILRCAQDDKFVVMHTSLLLWSMEEAILASSLLIFLERFLLFSR